MNNFAEVVSSLRDCANWLESVQDKIDATASLGMINIRPNSLDKEENLAAIRAFITSLPNTEKRDYGNFFCFVAYPGKDFRVDLNIQKETTCRRVEEEVEIPFRPAELIPAVEAHTEIQTKWICPDSFLKPGEDEQAEEKAEFEAAERDAIES